MNDFDPLLLPPDLLSVPGVTPGLLQSLFMAAADFYAIQPWKALDSETIIKVRCPTLAQPRLVVVMGAAGQAFGISVYDSPADLQRMYQAADPLDAAGALCWLALTYETAEYLAHEDLDAIDKYGWQVAGAMAYPAIARIGSPGPDLQPPTLQDLYWLDGCLRALSQFFVSYLSLDEQGKPRPVEVTLPVATSAGTFETRVCLPGLRV